MLINQFNRLVPGQRIIDSTGRELQIVQKEQGKQIGPYFLPVTFGGYQFTMKTKIAGQSVLCTTTTDRGDPDFSECEDWISACQTLGKVWESGDSGDLTSEVISQ